MKRTNFNHKGNMKPYSLCLLAFVCLGSIAFSQTNDALPLPGAGADAVAGILSGLLAAYAGKYGWLVSVIAVIGTLRLCVKPIMLIAEAVVKATPSPQDDAAIANFERGAVYRWLLWCVDWIASIKPVTASTTNPVVEPK